MRPDMAKRQPYNAATGWWNDRILSACPSNSRRADMQDRHRISRHRARRKNRPNNASIITRELTYSPAERNKMTKKDLMQICSGDLLASANPAPSTLDGIADAVHELAWAKGWHKADEDEDAFVERMCNNLHDEVSELHEAWRNNQLRAPCDKASKMIDLDITPLSCIEEEMADIIIRVLDNARKLGVNIQSAVARKHQFNTTRPQRHGGKRS